MRVGRDVRMLCGTDMRRSGMGPEDAARAESFVARYGGTLYAGPVGDAAVSVTWDAESGQRVMVTGETFGEALGKLRGQVQ